MHGMHCYLPPRLSLGSYPSDAGDVSTVPYQGAGTYMSTGSEVALRKDPEISVPPYGDGSNAIEYVGKGDILDGTDQRRDGFAWVTHRVTGASGWMSEKYLTPSNAPGDVMVDVDYVPPVLAGPGPEVVPVVAEETQKESGSGVGVVIGLLLIVAVGYGLAK